MALRNLWLLGAAATLLGVVGLAEALDAEVPDDPVARVLHLLPTQDDLLVNLDPADLPSTTDMVRLGRRATPAIINGLVNSMSEQVRSSCAAVLTATRDPRAITALIDALDDPDDGVRYLALQALGMVESRSSTPRVLTLLAKPGVAAYVRSEAIRTLGRIGDPAAVEPLMRRFRTTWDPAAQEALWDMRMQLGTSALEDIVVPPLEAAGKDSGPPHDVVAFAVERAGDLRLSDAVDPLIALFPARPNLQNRIVYALGLIGDRSALKFLRAQLDSTGDARLMNNVTFALQRLGEDVTPFLRGMLADRRAYIRFNAAFVAGDLREARLVDALIAALSDPNDVVRSEAAVALGRIASPAATPALEAALASENEIVRRDVLLALASIDYPRWRDRIVSELLPSEHPSVREKAARFLAGRRDPELVGPVLAALSPDEWDDAALALQFLGRFDRLEDERATAWLLRAAAGNVRREALVLLARFADERARFVLRQWLSQPGGEQDQLLRALGRLRDTASEPLARHWLAREEAARSQVYAAFVLASLGDGEAAKQLLRALEEGPTEMKRVVATVLTELDLERVPGTREALSALLAHEDVTVRLYAARALAQVGDAAAFALLGRELDKRIPFVRDEVLDIAERAPRALAQPALEAWAKAGPAPLRAEIDRILAKP
ncbi:MAG: hypothetical protein AMXMBFR64_42160 [Myxococcales bacterium]